MAFALRGRTEKKDGSVFEVGNNHVVTTLLHIRYELFNHQLQAVAKNPKGLSWPL